MLQAAKERVPSLLFREGPAPFFASAESALTPPGCVSIMFGASENVIVAWMTPSISKVERVPSPFRSPLAVAFHVTSAAEPSVVVKLYM